ncbi:hypothetical protein [Falsibacillus albus]|uniref:DUF3887 domain-containing protein n=1 Tax=Falsibacillus albus TaxID=2478915 RepID=A0A3L7JWV5_9BACI|nr:hypothetical protein [Falsibacillus albus]RLQ94609.1 hypothetical protein D9X91_13820 [Falsibacillus albus]
MKKVLLLVFSMFLLFGLCACSNQNGQASNNDQNTLELDSKHEDVREVVWSQLPAQQKESIKGTWKDAKVSKITLEKNMMSGVKDKSYEGKEVYRIMLPTDGKSEPNFTVVFADLNTFDYIGYALVQ